MRKLLVIANLFLIISCTNKKIPEPNSTNHVVESYKNTTLDFIDFKRENCEYFITISQSGNSLLRYGSVTHKGNCKNHK